MVEDRNRILREQSLAFFGAITASLSHEISNSVAIINELSGLLDDLLLGADRGRPLDNGKLRDLSSRIGNQVQKGRSLIKRLNRFSHSVDDPVKTFDLKALLEDITELSQRFAFLENVRLEADLSAESIEISSNPFSVQQAVFICICLGLEASKEGELVHITFNENGSRAEISVTSACSDRTGDVDKKLEFLKILMQELNGTVELEVVSADKQDIRLHLPLHTSERSPAT